MKRFFAGVVKFLVVLGLIAGLAYSVVRYWDCIVEFVERVRSLCKGCCRPAEADDYADWDE